MEKFYLIGGSNSRDDYTRAICLEFDRKSYEWNKMTRMHEERESSACAIFAGRIVVSGGMA